jgi:membrane protease YdiL (CAAX protease family)
MEIRSLATIGLPWRPSLSTFSLGLALGTIVPALVTLLLGFLGFAIVRPNAMSVGLLLGTTLPMVGATILLSTWEELAFRGYPLQLLIVWTGPWPAALATGILFGLAHAGNPGANALGFLNTAINGVLLAWIVMRTGSLWLACGYHTGWNFMASQVLGLVDSGVQAPGSLLATQLTGPDWVGGGGYGFEASAVTGLLEAALLGVLVWQARRLPQVESALLYFRRARTAAS